MSWRELGGYPIAANTVSPSAIETDFGGGAMRHHLRINKTFVDKCMPGQASRLFEEIHCG